MLMVLAFVSELSSLASSVPLELVANSSVMYIIICYLLLCDILFCRFMSNDIIFTQSIHCC